MTTENYAVATKLVESMERDKKRLEKLALYNIAPDAHNPSTQNHKILMKADNGKTDTMYFEVLDPKMVKYLHTQEVNLIKSRIAKNKILLSKL